jgi:V/A-type H+/Na+-transporting ATPase subunit D
MPEVKLTKNELRFQQSRLSQLEKYLPTLQLKKAMLQIEVADARLEIAKFEGEYQNVHASVEEYAALLSDKTAIDPTHVATITQVKKHYENIAGVEVPYYDGMVFSEFRYNLFDTPAWVDTVILGIRSLAEKKAKTDVSREKKAALEKELREVSIRVNLFEKILIPRAKENIKKIKVFLGDQQLTAVSQAKVAKSKIEAAKLLKRQLKKQGAAHAL